MTEVRRIRDAIRTVDTATAAEALTARYCCSAAAQDHARFSNMRTDGARVWREVTQESQGIGVRGIVVRRGACLE